MNNPFDRSSHSHSHYAGPAAAGINNPFDNDPTSARNRFPDISSGSNLAGSQYGSLPASPPPQAQFGQQQYGQVGQVGYTGQGGYGGYGGSGGYNPSGAGGFNQLNQQPQQTPQPQQYGQYNSASQTPNSSLYSGFGSNPQSPYGQPTGNMAAQGYMGAMGSSQFGSGTPGTPYGGS